MYMNIEYCIFGRIMASFPGILYEFRFTQFTNKEGKCREGWGTMVVNWCRKLMTNKFQSIVNHNNLALLLRLLLSVWQWHALIRNSWP